MYDAGAVAVVEWAWPRGWCWYCWESMALVALLPLVVLVALVTDLSMSHSFRSSLVSWRKSLTEASSAWSTLALRPSNSWAWVGRGSSAADSWAWSTLAWSAESISSPSAFRLSSAWTARSVRESASKSSREATEAREDSRVATSALRATLDSTVSRARRIESREEEKSDCVSAEEETSWFPSSTVSPLTDWSSPREALRSREDWKEREVVSIMSSTCLTSALEASAAWNSEASTFASRSAWSSMRAWRRRVTSDSRTVMTDPSPEEDARPPPPSPPRPEPEEGPTTFSMRAMEERSAERSSMEAFEATRAAVSALFAFASRPARSSWAMCESSRRASAEAFEESIESMSSTFALRESSRATSWTSAFEASISSTSARSSLRARPEASMRSEAFSATAAFVSASAVERSLRKEARARLRVSASDFEPSSRESWRS